MSTNTLSPELLARMDAYWRAANYLSVGQIYLYDNPLLKRRLTLADVKHMLLGHWGTTPGQNFVYVHLNRVIKKYDLDMIYVSGPGHGGPAVVGNTYLEGTYSEIYPDISQDEAGLQKAVSPVLVSRRHPEPRLAGVPGLDPRGRRAGLFAQPFVRSRLRQPRSHRRLRRRRRRGGDRSARHRMAFEQVPRCGHRRRGAADPPSQRLQDLEPDHPRPHHPRGAGGVPPRMRVDAHLRRGSRARADARGDGGRARHGGGADQAHPAGGAGSRQSRASALADDRPQFTQGLDGAEGRGWPSDRGHVPGSPDSGLPYRPRLLPNTSSCWRTGSRATGRTNCSTSRAA